MRRAAPAGSFKTHGGVGAAWRAARGEDARAAPRELRRRARAYDARDAGPDHLAAGVGRERPAAAGVPARRLLAELDAAAGTAPRLPRRSKGPTPAWSRSRPSTRRTSACGTGPRRRRARRAVATPSSMTSYGEGLARRRPALHAEERRRPVRVQDHQAAGGACWDRLHVEISAARSWTTRRHLPAARGLLREAAGPPDLRPLHGRALGLFDGRLAARPAPAAARRGDGARASRANAVGGELHARARRLPPRLEAPELAPGVGRARRALNSSTSA